MKPGREGGREEGLDAKTDGPTYCQFLTDSFLDMFQRVKECPWLQWKETRAHADTVCERDCGH